MRKLPAVPARKDALPQQTDRPFPEALDAIRIAAGLSWTGFTEAMNAHGKGWGRSYLNGLVLGTYQVPGTEAMLELAGAAAKVGGVKATYFKEVRQALAAEKASRLAAQVGLDEVLAALDKLERRRKRT